MKHKTNDKKSFLAKLKSSKRGQIFLVCTVIIIIYMLSFITIIFELNKNQYTQIVETKDIENAFENFKVETNNFMLGMLANYSLPATLIDSNATASIFLQDWLDFAEKQMIARGYIAIFEIDEIVPVTLPIEIVKINGRMAIRAYIDVMLANNYLTIDTQLVCYYNYSTTYVNTATNGYITLYCEDSYNQNFVGYAEVTVNGATTANLYNGTYVYSAPLAPGDVIQCVTTDQIIITRIV
ncbi:MAG: hypothetical protein ACTSO7_08430 [Candidatus Heimdallarchaeota archaeon]